MLEKREADVIIIGGGIMGCATAYRLAKQGVDVLVLEKKEIGNGGSCRKRSERIAVGNVRRCKHLAAPERRIRRGCRIPSGRQPAAWSDGKRY